MGGEQDAAAPIVHVSTASYSEREARAAVMELAIFSCVNLIAETAARAEVRTFHKNKELHGLEHYAWNVQPNINQNAMQLKRELFARALYFGEALLVEVNGQMLVAQSFQRAEHATAPDEFFGIVLRGDTAIKRRLTSDEVTEIDRANIGKDLEQFIADTIRAAFVENADDYQNVQGLRVQADTHTKGAALNIKSDVHDLMDIIVRALTVYNVAVTVELRPQEKAIAATVAKVSSAGRVIEADLPNVIEKNVYLMDTYGSLNKATYINKDDPAQRAVYYLDGETGEPTETPKSRITPVFFKVEYIEGAEDFALEAEQRAREDLTPEDFDNLIEITVHDGDKLIPPEKIRIGEIVTIKANGQSWQSVLTGYEKTQNTHKFVFGYVRVDLDKILRIERRGRA